MKRVVIVCEGPTEQEFCKEILYDYFIKKDICIETPLIKHSGGGVVPWSTLNRQVSKHLCEKDVYVSIFIDYYGIKDSYKYPKWEEAKQISNHKERVEFLEAAMQEQLCQRFIPHLQLHEFESLLFSDISVFEKSFMPSELKMDKLRHTIKEFPSPEDINNSPNTAPSKRIEDAVLGYKKVLYGNLLAMEIGIDKILATCPHFRKWIEDIQNVV